MTGNEDTIEESSRSCEQFFLMAKGKNLGMVEKLRETIFDGFHGAEKKLQMVPQSSIRSELKVIPLRRVVRIE